MIFTLLVVLLVLTLAGGGWGYSRFGAAGGLGPVGVLMLILVTLYFTGNLHG